MVSLVAIVTWRIPAWVVLPMFLIFGSLDGVYLTSVLIKVPNGAWFTLLLAFILSSVFILWRFGKEAQWNAESLDRLRASSLLTTATAASSSSLPSPNAPTLLRLAPPFNPTPVSTVPGLGIFFDKSGDQNMLPPSFTHFVRKFAARPSVLVFFHMRPLPVPTVPLGERYVVSRSPGAAGLLPNSYNVVLRHGYTDDVLRPGMARDLVAQIELAVSRGVTGGENEKDHHHVVVQDTSIASELAALRRACEAQTVYVLGKEVMRIRRPSRWSAWAFSRRMLLEVFLWIRENSRTKLADMDIDVDKLIEVGFVKEI